MPDGSSVGKDNLLAWVQPPAGPILKRCPDGHPLKDIPPRGTTSPLCGLISASVTTTRTAPRRPIWGGPTRADSHQLPERTGPR
jgi:hypothetical protein